MKQNCDQTLDLGVIEDVYVNLPLIKHHATCLSSLYSLSKKERIEWLLKTVSFIDLTTLSGDDTSSNVRRLCWKAAHPVQEEILDKLDTTIENGFRCGAVCVYPARVAVAASTIKSMNSDLPVAAVATGFPSGQYSLRSRLAEIEFAVESGASEIDIVISRELALSGKWEELFEELVEMKKACGSAHMKSILAVGELGSLSNVYKASMVAMMAGSDFIKTSTGKESVNATIPVGIVMCRAIRDYYDRTGIKVGFKPAGGIKTAKDAIVWLTLIKVELGDEWLNRDLFRIGASSLLGDIERQLYFLANGVYPSANQLPMS